MLACVEIFKKRVLQLTPRYFVPCVPLGYHMRVHYEKIFRSTCATDPISIFVFALRELQRFLTYLLLQLSNVSQADVSSHYNKQSVDRV